MKMYKLVFTAIVCLFVQTQVFCVDETTTSAPLSSLMSTATADTSGITAAINNAKDAIIDQLIGSVTNINSEMARLFDETFKGTGAYNYRTKTWANPSTLDDKISMYASNFYNWYATDDWYRKFASVDFTQRDKDNESAMHQLSSREIGYNVKKNAKERFVDSKALLLKRFGDEGGVRFSAADLGVGITANPFGSLSPAPAPKENPLSDLFGGFSIDPIAAYNALITDAPNVNDLTGVDGYVDADKEEKAKLFISYLLQSTPPPKNFYIPPKGTGKNTKIYIPADDPASGRSYRIVSVPTSDYDKAVKYLATNTKYYQSYKMKVRAINVLRTLYTDNLRRAYQERVRGSDGKSLVEKEKELAYAGLDKKYYDDLRNMSVADVNLETLYAINKLAYFVYKLHQDNERVALIMAASGMRLAGQDSADEMNYVKPINRLIDNKCWQYGEGSKKTPKVCSKPEDMSPSPEEMEAMKRDMSKNAKKV